MRHPMRTIIRRCHRQRSCARSSAWRPSARSVTTGWCGTKITFIKWKPAPESRAGQEQGQEAELSRDRGACCQAGRGAAETAEAANADCGSYGGSSLAVELPGHASAGCPRRPPPLRPKRSPTAAGLRAGRRHGKPYGPKNIRKGTLLLHVAWGDY